MLNLNYLAMELSHVEVCMKGILLMAYLAYRLANIGSSENVRYAIERHDRLSHKSWEV